MCAQSVIFLSTRCCLAGGMPLSHRGYAIAYNANNFSAALSSLVLVLFGVDKSTWPRRGNRLLPEPAIYDNSNNLNVAVLLIKS